MQQRRFSGSSRKEMFSDTASNDDDGDGADGTADYDELFKNDHLATGGVGGGGGGGGGDSEEGGRGRGGMPYEETRRGPQVRYDPTLTAVQAYAEREYGYDDGGRGSVSAFDPDMMTRVEVAVNADEMYDVHQNAAARSNRRRCVCCVALVVAAGSAVIGTSVAYAKKKNAGGGNSAAGTASAVLVAPPQALEQMCSIRNIAREEGHRECEGACGAAACCMAAGTKSCFLEQEGICGMYSPCGVLHSQTEGGGEYSSYSSAGGGPGDTAAAVVPPPPSDLEAQCSDASLSSINGYIACQSACHPGRCCYAGSPHEEGGASAASSASSAANNIPFTSGAYAVESCVQSHRHVCLGYAPCLALGGTGHDDPKRTVERKCTPDAVKNRAGRDACDDLCKARSCCFASSEKRNCRIDNKQWCAEYQACEVLLDKPPVQTHTGEFGDVDVLDSPDAAAIASDRCAPSKIITHNDLLYCEDACRPALCCFYDDVECDSAFERETRCNAYLFCEPVVAKMFDFGGIDLSNGDLGVPAGEGGVPVGGGGGGGGGNNFEPSDALGSAVAEACDPAALGTASGRDDCRVLCEPYLCCADPGPNGCASNRECPRYEECANLLQVEGGIVPPDPYGMTPDERPVGEGGGDNDNEGYGTPTTGFDPDTTDVALACDEAYLENVPGRCAFLCRGMLCCFDYSDDTGCYLNPDCARFGACGVLAETAGDGGLDSAAVTTLSVNDACDPATIADAAKEKACGALCASHRCCFDGTCPQMGTVCDEYDACDIIFNNLVDENDPNDDGSGAMPDPPADLEKVCNPFKIDEGDNRRNCLDDCLMGNCCRGVGGSDCRNMERFCDEFIMCETVWDDDGSEGFQQQGGGGGNGPTAAMIPVGQAGVTQPQNPGARPPPVEAASVASAPSGGTGTGDPKVLCSIFNLEKSGGRKECDDACRPWQCCWGDNSKGEDNCFDENTTTCLKYLDCPMNSGD